MTHVYSNNIIIKFNYINKSIKRNNFFIQYINIYSKTLLKAAYSIHVYDLLLHTGN